MHTAGFKWVTGLDCSEAMLYESERKKVYSDLEKVTLGGENFVNDFPVSLRNRFDFATCAGLIEATSPQEYLFDQLLLSLKKDGYFIFTA